VFLLQLTLSDPAPKPFKCSKLAGRKPVLTSEPDVATEQQQAALAAAAAAAAAKAQPTVAAAAAKAQPTATAVAAAVVPEEHEGEGCGDTHASEDEGVGPEMQAAGATAKAAVAGGPGSDRTVRQLLGKRKVERSAGTSSDRRQRNAADGSLKQPRKQVMEEAVPAISRAGGACAAATGCNDFCGAVSDRLSPGPAAVPAASHDSTHGPAGAQAGAVGAAVGIEHSSHDNLQAVAGAVAAAALASARSDVTAAGALIAAAGGGLVTCSASCQPRGPTPEVLGAVVAAAATAAMTTSAVSQERAGALEPMHAPRPKVLRGLSMTRTKSVPIDLCVMEVASTASSRPTVAVE
jgi:hypothetical protein